jgi:hypothetical protein
MSRLPYFVLLLPILGACTLIDQTTFAPSPEPKPVVAPEPPPIETRKPLIVIAATATPKDYAKSLRDAVRAAEKSRRDIDYDVVGVAPGTTDADGKPAAASVVAREEAGSHAAEVMRAIMALGVPAARIHLAARSDGAVTAGEIRVYVR